MKKSELILALDLASKEEVNVVLDSIGPVLRWVKVGLQLFTRYGPDIVFQLADKGYQVFLDLKLHDIPHQVASAVRSLSQCPCQLLTVHAGGGRAMMQAAKEAAEGSDLQLLGVTVLTSINAELLREVGVLDKVENQVLRLARLTEAAGLSGLVCSPMELVLLRKHMGEAFVLVTPGIRMKGSERDEQKRVMGPEEASSLGADFIVVGRPILRAEDPAEAARCILEALS